MRAKSSTGLQVDAILFDVDGTIADTEEAHREAFNAAFADFGLDWRWSRCTYKPLLKVTGGKERMRHYSTLLDPSRTGETALPINEIHARKTKYFGDIIVSGTVELRPGIHRLMHAARKLNIKLAIATTMSRPSLDALLPHLLGVDSYDMFSSIATGDRVAAKKPAPDIYELALSELNVPASRAIAIEDSAVGLEAARAAGLPTLIAPSSYTQGEDFSGAALVVSDLGEREAPLEVLSEHVKIDPSDPPILCDVTAEREFGLRTRTGDFSALA